MRLDVSQQLVFLGVLKKVFHTLGVRGYHAPSRQRLLNNDIGMGRGPIHQRFSVYGNDAISAMEDLAKAAFSVVFFVAHTEKLFQVVVFNELLALLWHPSRTLLGDDAARFSFSSHYVQTVACESKA